MALTIDRILVGDVAVLRAHGEITAGEEGDFLREVIRQTLETGQRNILLNLQGVSHIDSAGVGALVSAYTFVRSRGGVIKLVGLLQPGRDQLQASKISSIFEVAKNEDEALGGDWPGPRAI